MNKQRSSKNLRDLSPNVARNDAFEIALQKKNYSIAECILRDLSLNDAVKSNKPEALFNPNCFSRRRNSFQLQDCNILEIEKHEDVCSSNSLQFFNKSSH